MTKYISFTKTPLLNIGSGVDIDDWNAINKCMLVEKIINSIGNIKWINNLGHKKKKERDA